MNTRFRAAPAVFFAAGILLVAAAPSVLANVEHTMRDTNVSAGVHTALARYAPISDRRQQSTPQAVDLFVSLSPDGDGVNFGAGMVEEEQRIVVGGSIGMLAANVFAGRGEDYSRLDATGPSLDPYFFHGGAAHEFSYRGAALDFAVTRALGLQFALSDIDAAGLDTRRTIYAGLSSQRASGGLFSIARDDDITATGAAFSFTGKAATVQARQISHESGAVFRSLGFSRNHADGGFFAFSVESGRNPLFRDNDETRVMLRFGGTLGAARHRLNAAETVAGESEGGDERTSAHRGRNLALLAGAVVAVGAASSSGSDSQDDAIRISGRNNAARQILNRINPVSVRENREHGGWIYRNRDGTYGYTDPVAGTVASVDIGAKSSVPRGTLASASYHTHGGPDPRYDNENFSPADLLSDRLQQVDGYLGTPAGQFKLHEHRTGRIVLLGAIAH